MKITPYLLIFFLVINPFIKLLFAQQGEKQIEYS